MHHTNVAIIGAGIVGLSTAYALLCKGVKNVYLLEQSSIGHTRGTSYGLSRLLRFEYGSDLLYTRMVRQSQQAWRSLERRSQTTLYTRTGMLVLGREDDKDILSSYRLLRDEGLPIEMLSRQTCHMLFPQFNTQNYEIFTYNVDAGLLHASICLQTLKSLILDMGGKIITGCRVIRITHENSRMPIRLLMEDHADLVTERLVLATGPWVHTLLADLRLPVRMTRQYALYFVGLPASAFALPNFPAFMADDLYGFPIHNSNVKGYDPGWLKVASHTFGPPADPDAPPIIEQSSITKLTERLCGLFPQLRQSTLAHVDACMYDVSPDEDFILDYHPDDPRIVFATGLSGHGFKFGPLLGEILGSLLYQTAPIVPTERFRLTRFSQCSPEPTPSVA